jgi:transposase
MANIKSVELTDDERAALERSWRRGKSHAFRQRCRMVLLKAERRTSKDVAAQVGCCEVVVNNWLKRYGAHGLDGLQTQSGQGRKPILSREADLAAVRRAVQQNRQRVSLARAELTQELGKGFSDLTLRRFLKKVAAASGAFGGE